MSMIGMGPPKSHARYQRELSKRDAQTANRTQNPVLPLMHDDPREGVHEEAGRHGSLLWRVMVELAEPSFCRSLQPAVSPTHARGSTVKTSNSSSVDCCHLDGGVGESVEQQPALRRKDYTCSAMLLFHFLDRQ